MQTPGSIVICGPYARCMTLAKACASAGIHPTLLLPAGSREEQGAGTAIYTTSDPFSCVADLVVDCSDDDPGTVVARYNQLSEINHGDVVFVLNANMAELEAAASRIMHPGRVIAADWNLTDPALTCIRTTLLTNESTVNTTSLFFQMLRNGHRSENAALTT